MGAVEVVVPLELVVVVVDRPGRVVEVEDPDVVGGSCVVGTVVVVVLLGLVVLVVD